MDQLCTDVDIDNVVSPFMSSLSSLNTEPAPSGCNVITGSYPNLRISGRKFHAIDQTTASQSPCMST